MELKRLEAIKDAMLFKIQEDQEKAGCYLFVYKDGKCIMDYLQNSVKDCKEFAEEEFGVSVDCWNDSIS